MKAKARNNGENRSESINNNGNGENENIVMANMYQRKKMRKENNENGINVS
jgi:hypothetical protein